MFQFHCLEAILVPILKDTTDSFEVYFVFQVSIITLPYWQMRGKRLVAWKQIA